MSTYQNLPAPSPEQGLNRYMQEIRKFPMLEPEQEYMLAKRWVDHQDSQAAHKMVTSHLRLAAKIAMGYRGYGLPQSEVISEANVGLMQAVKRFDPEKGFRLATYAMWWIRASIQEYILRSWSLVKMGTTTAQRKLFFNLRKEAEKLLAEYDQVDTKLLASNLNVREKDVVEMQQRLSGPDLSFDEPVSEGSDVTRGSTYADPGESVEDILAKKEVQAIFKKHLDEFKKRITGRDLELFEDRLLSVQPMTLQEFGERHGISRERARQIEVRLMQKLKEFVREKGFV